MKIMSYCKNHDPQNRFHIKLKYKIELLISLFVFREKYDLAMSLTCSFIRLHDWVSFVREHHTAAHHSAQDDSQQSECLKKRKKTGHAQSPQDLDADGLDHHVNYITPVTGG